MTRIQVSMLCDVCGAAVSTVSTYFDSSRRPDELKAGPRLFDLLDEANALAVGSGATIATNRSTCCNCKPESVHQKL